MKGWWIPLCDMWWDVPSNQPLNMKRNLYKNGCLQPCHTSINFAKILLKLSFNFHMKFFYLPWRLFFSFYWFHCYLFYNMFDLPHEKAKSTNRYRKQNLQISKIMRLNITWMLMLIWWNFFVLFSLVKAQDMGWQKKYKLISRKKICLLLQRDPERVWLKKNIFYK